MPEEKELVAGEAQRVGIKTERSSSITHCVNGKTRVAHVDLPDHAAAFRAVLALLAQDRKKTNIRFDVCAHRYVHPGNYFDKTTIVDSRTLKKLKETLRLAPIHNPISFSLVELMHKESKETAQCVVFDTSFHRTIPKEFYTYAIPHTLAHKYGIRRVGFHGISHEYVMHQGCRFLKRDVSTQRIVSCHLGTGGSSVCAIKGGKSVNSSMGFTPLEGLIMNTRSGDMDLGLFFYVMNQEGFDSRQAEDIANKKSGVLAIFNVSSDLRDAVEITGRNKSAKLACDMYVARVKKYISYFALILKKADILIFTDSLGVGVPALRQKICEGLHSLGIHIDEKKNTGYRKGIADIAAAFSQTRILVVPTDEEIMIARNAYKEFVHANRG